MGRQRRFVLTRYGEPGELTDWTITHVPTGREVASLVPARMPRTLNALGAVVRAWDALEGLDWGVIDDLPHAGAIDHREHHERAGALASRLQAEASKVYADFGAARRMAGTRAKALAAWDAEYG